MFLREHFPDLTKQEERFERMVAQFPEHDRERIRTAIAVARRVHAGQYRRGTSHVPYIIHPIRVACTLVDEFAYCDADAAIVALLHDAVEDGSLTLGAVRKTFGEKIRRYVRWLTWDHAIDAKWASAQKLFRGAPRSVIMVKASDILDNARNTWDLDSREQLLRMLYGYRHWGLPIIAAAGPMVVPLFERSFFRTKQVHFVNDQPSLAANPGKQLTITLVSGIGSPVSRYPIRTHLITTTDDLLAIIRQYALPHLIPGDLLAISERIVAIMQGRAYALTDIHPSRLAKLLVRFVTKSPYGIGLGSPWTMELAIREAGISRMLVAAVVAAVTKPFGIRGMFYRVVGKHINAIDGPCDYTLAPFGKYAKLGPKDPDGVATTLARTFGVDVAIIDANDLGVNVLGVSDGVNRAFVAVVFRDNPLGQTDEQTPMAIVRTAHKNADPL